MLDARSPQYVRLLFRLDFIPFFSAIISYFPHKPICIYLISLYCYYKQANVRRDGTL